MQKLTHRKCTCCGLIYPYDPKARQHERRGRMCKPCHMALVAAENAEKFRVYARQPRKSRHEPEEPKPVWHGLAEENYNDDFLRGM